MTEETPVGWKGKKGNEYDDFITETNWHAVRIAWDNGQVATVHHGDMREIHTTWASPKGV